MVKTSREEAEKENITFDLDKLVQKFRRDVSENITKQIGVALSREVTRDIKIRTSDFDVYLWKKGEESLARALSESTSISMFEYNKEEKYLHIRIRPDLHRRFFNKSIYDLMVYVNITLMKRNPKDRSQHSGAVNKNFKLIIGNQLSYDEDDLEKVKNSILVKILNYIKKIEL